jgi:chromosome partitioning protein
MTYVIAVANEKGGVAKTTTVLSLGASLAEMGRKILLLDLDPQANLTLSVGIKPNGLSDTVSDILLGGKSSDQVQYELNQDGVTLIPANHELILAEQYLTVRDNYELLLRNSINSHHEADIALIDCPPALGPLTRCALCSADMLIIPTQCEYYSAHALKDMLSLIRDIRLSKNPRLRYRLLMTLYDRRNRIHRSLEEQIRSAFGEAVFETMIEIDTRFRESPIFGQPITEYAPRSRGAAQYRQLAEELGHHAKETIRTAAGPA